jgi:PAT family beta-lactamase induction signal transducer AmpG
MNKLESKHNSPWKWIPTLYIAEGLPYFAVNTLTVLMYVKLGIGVAEMSFFTSWLYLPWVIKPFWSPFVDILKTKRFWVIAMQICIAICMASVAFLLPTSFFFSTTLAVFWLMAFFSATHDIAADGYYMLELSPHEQAAFVGVRSTFYRIASVLGQGGLVVLAGIIEEKSGNISLSWSVVFLLLSLLFFAVSLWHHFMLPHAKADVSRKTLRTARDIGHEFIMTFVTFFKKKYIVSAICFMLLYRLPEALCVKLVLPFLVAPLDEGGLGLSTFQVGWANGVVGVVALLAGGIVGGIAISVKGLKTWLWPMALSLTLPSALYCYLAMSQSQNFILICTAIGVEQFGYGFGFSAFMLYLIYFSQGNDKTSHYAFCTAFMALGMMIPGMIAGWIHDILSSVNPFDIVGPVGYVNFFWCVMICCLATFGSCLAIKIDPEFGKK